jgi:hypothetical protein
VKSPGIIRFFPDPPQAIQVGVAAIAQDLRQPGVQVQCVGRGHVFDRLRRAIAHCVVAVAELIAVADFALRAPVRTGVGQPVERIILVLPAEALVDDPACHHRRLSN